MTNKEKIDRNGGYGTNNERKQKPSKKYQSSKASKTMQ